MIVLAGLVLLGFDAADFTITGPSVLATLFIVIGLWLGGVFTVDAWVCDDETSKRLSQVDEELLWEEGRL
ncbi:MAG: hypothetical protein QM677_04955 [Microbacterium sp.]